ncbi:MAG: hypothetical protein ACREYE_10545 [Gammaproteobacteria bacterium]
MSETIAITGKSVKLLKGHYTSLQFQVSALVARGRGSRCELLRRTLSL